MTSTRRPSFTEQLATAYGMTEAALYMRVTGQPIWLDAGAPGQRTAQRKWDAFLEDCRTRIAAA